MVGLSCNQLDWKYMHPVFYVLKVGFQCFAMLYFVHRKWTFILVFGRRKLGDQTSSVKTQ